MDILVVAATREEIAPSLGFLKDHNIRFLISGVGMMQTAFSLAGVLQEKPADLILQVGIGGILDPEAELAQIYQITTDEIFDFGSQDNDKLLTMESLGLAKGQFGERRPVGVTLPKVKLAHGITVNTVHGNSSSIQSLHARYNNQLVESMEGVAAFYAGERTQTDVLQYRAISNYIEPRNRENWVIGSAITNLNEFLQQIIDGLA